MRIGEFSSAFGSFKFYSEASAHTKYFTTGKVVGMLGRSQPNDRWICAQAEATDDSAIGITNWIVLVKMAAPSPYRRSAFFALSNRHVLFPRATR
jgi:hypothetical protein